MPAHLRAEALQRPVVVAAETEQIRNERVRAGGGGAKRAQAHLEARALGSTIVTITKLEQPPEPRDHGQERTGGGQLRTLELEPPVGTIGQRVEQGTDEGGLADPGLAGDEHGLAPVFAATVRGRDHRCDFASPTDGCW